MKTALLLAALFAMAPKAHADEVMQSSVTFQTVTMSTITPTNMDSAARVMNDRVAVAVQNIDSTAKVYCSEKSAGLTVGNGFLLSPNGGSLALSATAGGPNGPIKIYCISDTASSKVNLVQGK